MKFLESRSHVIIVIASILPSSIGYIVTWYPRMNIFIQSVSNKKM